MPSADEFDTCEAASQQNQHCKSTDVDRAPPHGCENAAPPQGDHRQRHGHARPELPPRGGSFPRLAAQRALAALQARGAERPVRVFARACAASPIYRIPVICSRVAGPRRRRGAARPRGNGHREAPARHRRVLRRRGPGCCFDTLRPAATEGRRRLVEEEEVAAAVEEEGVLSCVRSVRKQGSSGVGGGGGSSTPLLLSYTKYASRSVC